MDSKTYWKQREEEQLKYYITQEAEYQKQIEKIYNYMMVQIQKEINGFYAKYASREGITLAEAKKRVSELDIGVYERKAEKYVKNKTFTAEANEEMRLYNATMKINRLELLKANIGLELVDGFDELQKYYDTILTDRTLEEFERQAGILGKTIQNNAETAHSIVNASFHNATFSDRIWMYQDMLKAELSTLLQQGLIQGKNPRELARHLTKRFGVAKSNAERLMRTELARVQIEAQKQSFERNGFRQYTFITNGGCCSVCAGLNGKHFNVEKMMPGTNAPPMHPNCRCGVAAYEDSEDYEAWLDFLDKGGTTEEWNRSRNFAEQEESKRKYKYKDTIVNVSEISSARYRKKFTDITGENRISGSLWKSALDVLSHRSGTKYEDLAFVDSKTGKAEINKNYDKENTASPSKRMKKMLRDADANTVIAIHNHPGSSAPSLADLQVCIQRKYKYGLVICHDGKIYKYMVNEEKFNRPKIISALARLEERGYNEDVKKQFIEAGVHMEVW